MTTNTKITLLFAQLFISILLLSGNEKTQQAEPRKVIL